MWSDVQGISERSRLFGLGTTGAAALLASKVRSLQLTIRAGRTCQPRTEDARSSRMCLLEVLGRFQIFFAARRIRTETTARESSDQRGGSGRCADVLPARRAASRRGARPRHARSLRGEVPRAGHHRETRSEHMRNVIHQAIHGS